MSNRFDKLHREFCEWQRATFPTQPIEGKIAHLCKEADELKQAPRDPEEMADCFLLILGIADIAGVDIVAEAEKKLAINKARKWGAMNPDGSVSHIGGKLPPSDGQPIYVGGDSVMPAAVVREYGGSVSAIAAFTPKLTPDELVAVEAYLEGKPVEESGGAIRAVGLIGLSLLGLGLFGWLLWRVVL